MTDVSNKNQATFVCYFIETRAKTLANSGDSRYNLGRRVSLMSMFHLPTASLLKNGSDLQTLRSVRQCSLPSSLRPNLFSGD